MRKKILFSLFLLAGAMTVWAGPNADKSGGILRDSGDEVVKLTRANGETYPTRQIELIIPLAAGGGTDIFCRQISTALYKIIGVPVVVNNVTGSSGMRGIGTALNARPDGYTLIAFNPPSQPLAQMLTNPGFDMRALTPISYYAYDAVTLYAHPSVPYNTFPELVEAYKSGRMSVMGATAVGSLDEIGARLLRDKAGLDYKSTVTYAGSGDLIAALLRKEVDIGVAPAGAGLNQVADGDLKAIMVLTAKRFPALPNVPSYGQDYGHESIDAVVQQNRIIAGPPGLPEDIRKYLEDAIAKALKDPELVAWATEQGLPILGEDGAAARAVLDNAFEIPNLIDLSQLNQ
jgi:tripartite-type tricarboxylate transporter receptor subunit TctC